MKFGKMALAAVFGFAAVGLGSGTQAASVSSLLLANDPTVIDTLNDIDGAYLINRAGGARTLDIGDSLRGMFLFDRINSATKNIGVGTGVAELTVVFQLLVSSKTSVADPSSPTGFRYTFGFAADPEFGKVLGSGSYAADSPGAVAVFYEDPSNNASFNQATAEASIATATDGTRFWTLGFTGSAGSVTYTPTGGGADVTLTGVVSPAANEIYVLSGLVSDDVNGVLNTSSGLTVGLGTVAFSRLFNAVAETGDGLVMLPVPTIHNPNLSADFVGTVNVLGGKQSPQPPFDSLSNAQFMVHVIPTPSAVIAGSLLLVGVVGWRMRRLV